jgi:hypothetical protein
MNKSIPLVVETYPDDYNGYEFITLIRYNDKNYLNIVDNVINNTIISYVLDYCQPAQISEEFIIDIAHEWFLTNKDKHPISIEFSKRGIVLETSKILRCFPIDYVARVIGPLPNYKMGGAYKVRKRKKKPIPIGVEIIEKLFPH